MKARKLGSGATKKSRKNRDKILKRGKSTTGKKTENPFELKFNRSKHDVLGKTRHALSVGRPGASRLRALATREKTLGVELRQFGKTNKIVDRRLGEHDPAVSAEERSARRFTASRVQLFSKGRRFRLEQDDDEASRQITLPCALPAEQLTHRGRALTSVEKFDQTMQSDEEGEDGGGEIGAEIVTAAHFGGQDSGDHLQGPHRSRKEMMSELIARTRLQREAKALQRDVQMDATERLDERLKTLMSHGAFGNALVPPRAKGERPERKANNDVYDLLLSDLRQSASAGRVTASERVKTPAEIAKDEADRLMRLEKERLRNAKTEARRSAKAQGSEQGDTGFEVRYDAHGRLLNADKVQAPKIKRVRICNDSDDDGQEDDSSEDDDEDDEEGDEEDEDEDGDEGDEEEDEETEQVGEDEDESFDAMDDVDESAGQEQTSQRDSPATTVKTSIKGDAARRDTVLPFVFAMPTSFSQLKELLMSHDSSEQPIIIDRLIKGHHPSLNKDNQRRLDRVFLFTLRLYDERAGQNADADLHGLEQALQSLYPITGEFANRCMRALLRKLRAQHDKRKHDAFAFNAIAFLRLANRLLAESAARHSLCSPAMLYAIEMIAHVRVVSARVLARMLVLVETVLEFANESRRYVPEAVAFLSGVLYLAIETGDWERPAITTFPFSMPHRRMLFVENKVDEIDPFPPVSAFFDAGNGDTSDSLSPLVDPPASLRLALLRKALTLIERYAGMYTTHGHSFIEVFQPVLRLLRRLPVGNYPTILADEVNALMTMINNEIAQRRAGPGGKRPAREKPVTSMLPLLEPRFETDFDPERPRLQRDAMRKGKISERKKLEHKYKRELKGTVRELRRDNQFIARERRRETSAKDADRVAKTKKLMSSLQGQEADFKENEKKKKKFKS